MINQNENGWDKAKDFLVNAVGVVAEVVKKYEEVIFYKGFQQGYDEAKREKIIRAIEAPKSIKRRGRPKKKNRLD